MATNWLFWIGLVIAGIGIALLTPLANYLPVDFLGVLQGIFGGDGPARYVRIVPGKDSSLPAYILLGAGTVLVALSYFLKASK